MNDAYKEGPKATERLASIVESSEDAIISKDLDGVIMSWNAGARRLFGYTAEEMVGRHISVLIPPDRQNEEPGILDSIRRGELVSHYETIRRRKDGSLVDISLTVSPVKDAEGRIIGASKIAHEITERRRLEEQQNLLLREMDHRVKNAFALAGTIVTLSARTAKTPQELAARVGERLQALARGHSLTLPGAPGEAEHSTTLHTLVRTVLSPYDGTNEYKARATIIGPDLPIAGRGITGFALLLHEFATNAAKYGALSTPYGYIEIECSEDGEHFLVRWTERGGPPVERTDAEGFGSLLARVTVKGQFGGEISREWKRDGLSILLRVDRKRIEGMAQS